MNNLNDQGNFKLEMRHHERKVDQLKTKNYDGMVTKLQNDLDILKDENVKMLAQYQKEMQKQ